MIGSLILMLFVLLCSIASFFKVCYLRGHHRTRYLPSILFTLAVIFYALKLLIFPYHGLVLELFDWLFLLLMLPIWVITIIETVLLDLKNVKKEAIDFYSSFSRTNDFQSFLQNLKLKWKKGLFLKNLNSFYMKKGMMKDLKQYKR